MKKAVIVAVAHHAVIGSNGSIPWHIPEDFKYFKATTMGSPVIMGRKTFESIGRLLPGRQNIIVSRQLTYQVEGAEVVHSLEAAYQIAQPATRCFVLGGQSLYAEAMHSADELYLTEIDLAVEGDTFFPKWSIEDWTLLQDQPMQSAQGIALRFLQYKRKV